MFVISVTTSHLSQYKQSSINIHIIFESLPSNVDYFVIDSGFRSRFPVPTDGRAVPGAGEAGL